MSDDQSRPAENVDPLTAPLWKIDEDIAPTIGEVVEEVLEVPIVSRNIPTPPDVDQILRGEYTGWVPLIKPGESLEEAKAREAKLDSGISQIVQNVDLDSWAPVEVVATDESDFISPKDLSSDSVRTVREPVVEVRPYAFPSEIVPDPDFVVSPAEALEEARRRIAQMRASLQTNINRVSQSFDHPIFAPIEVSVQEAPPFIPVTLTEVPAAAVVEEPK